MDKIYSRTKIRFSKKTDKRLRKTVKILLIIFISICWASLIINRFEPIINEQCVNTARGVIIKIINKEVAEVMKKYDYEDLFSIVYNEKKNIKMIETNVVVVNNIISSIPTNIQNELEKEENNTFEISIGSLTGVNLLSGRGQKITIKLLNSNILEANLRSEFIQQGINQTLHRIYLEVKCESVVSTPYKTFKGEVNSMVLISERVIIGEIPSTYYNLNGLDGDNAIDLIDQR